MESFAKYVGIQGLLAIGLTAAVITMTFMRIETPREVWGLLGVAWGFYFAKNGNNIASAVKSRKVQ